METFLASVINFRQQKRQKPEAYSLLRLLPESWLGLLPLGEGAKVIRPPFSVGAFHGGISSSCAVATVDDISHLVTDLNRQTA